MYDHKTSQELREKQNKIIVNCGSYRTQYLLGMNSTRVLIFVYG